MEKVPPKGGASWRRQLLTFLQALRQGRNFAFLPRISLSAGEESFSERELVRENWSSVHVSKLLFAVHAVFPEALGEGI